jgi:hypothetical protein
MRICSILLFLMPLYTPLAVTKPNERARSVLTNGDVLVTISAFRMPSGLGVDGMVLPTCLPVIVAVANAGAAYITLLSIAGHLLNANIIEPCCLPASVVLAVLVTFKRGSRGFFETSDDKAACALDNSKSIVSLAVAPRSTPVFAAVFRAKTRLF